MLKPLCCFAAPLFVLSRTTVRQIKCQQINTLLLSIQSYCCSRLKLLKRKIKQIEMYLIEGFRYIYLMSISSYTIQLGKMVILKNNFPYKCFFLCKEIAFLKFYLAIKVLFRKFPTSYLKLVVNWLRPNSLSLNFRFIIEYFKSLTLVSSFATGKDNFVAW